MIFDHALSDLPYFSKRVSAMKISSSQAGYFAVGSGNLLTIYKEENKSYIPISLSKRIPGQITCLSWCNAWKNNEDFLPYLFVGTQAGIGLVFDATTFKLIATIECNKSSILASVWSSVNTNYLIIATADLKIRLLILLPSGESELAYTLSVNWTITVDFPADFLNLEPQSSGLLIVASKSGRVTIINSLYTSDPQKCYFSKSFSPSNIIHIEFYTKIANTILFCTNSHVYLGFISEDTHVQIYEAIKANQILGIFHPSSNETTFGIITSTSFIHYELSDNKWVEISEFNFPNNNALSFTVDGPNSILVMGKQSIIELIHYVNGKFYVTQIIRGIGENPNQFSMNEELIAFCSKSSMLYLLKRSSLSDTKLSPLSQIIKIPHKGKIHQIELITQNKILVSMSDNNLFDVVEYNIQDKTFISILPKQCRNFIDSSIQINVQNQKRYFFINISTILLIYKVDIDETILLYSRFVTKDKVSVSWTCEGFIQIIGKDYHQTLMNEEGFITDIKNYHHKKVKGRPTSAISMVNGICLFGTKRGKVYLLTVREPVIVADFPSSVVSFKLSPDWLSVIACDIQGNSCVFRFNTNNQISSTPLKLKLRKIGWANNDTVFSKIYLSHSFAFLNVSKLVPVDTQINIPAKTYADRVDGFIKSIPKISSIYEIYTLAQEHHLASVYLPLKSLTDDYDSFSYGFNIDFNRTKTNLKDFIQTLENSNFDKFRMRIIRLLLLLDEKEKAFSYLLSTPSSDSQFTKNVFKAAISSTVLEKDKNDLVIKTLSTGNHVEDAIDILLLTGKYMESINLLLDNNNYSTAIYITKEFLKDEEKETSESQILSKLNNSDSTNQMISILLSLGKYQKAAEYAAKNNMFILSSVINCIETGSDGKAVFNPSNFHL